MKRFRTLLVTAVSAVALASCTYVPTDSQPQVVNVHNVPFNLLNRHPVTHPPATAAVTAR